MFSLEGKKEEETDEQTNNKNETTEMINRQYICHKHRHLYTYISSFLIARKKKKETLDRTLTRGYINARGDLYKRNKRNEKQKRSLVKKTFFFFFEYEI